MDLLIIILLFLFVLGIFLMLTRSKLSYLGISSIILAISIPDFYYIPMETDDLYRYYDEMNVISSCDNISSLLQIFKINPLLKHHSYNFIYDVFEWIISKTGIFSILPVLSVFITFLCVSIPAIHQSKYHISSVETIFCIILAISLFPYWTVSSTVRWELASGIFFLITYLYCNTRGFYKILSVILYLIPCFIHEGIIFPIILIIFCMFIKRIRWYHFIFILISFLVVLFIILPQHTMQYSTNIFDIASSYSNTSTSSSSLSAFLFYTFFPFISMILCGIGNVLLIKRNNNLLISKECILFYIFNFSILFFFSSSLMLSRYILSVESIDIMLYLKVNKIHGKISKWTNIIYILVIIINIFVSLHLSLGSMNFDFSHVYMF